MYLCNGRVSRRASRHRRDSFPFPHQGVCLTGDSTFNLRAVDGIQCFTLYPIYTCEALRGGLVASSGGNTSDYLTPKHTLLFGSSVSVAARWRPIKLCVSGHPEAQHPGESRGPHSPYQQTGR